MLYEVGMRTDREREREIDRERGERECFGVVVPCYCYPFLVYSNIFMISEFLIYDFSP